MAFFLSWSFSPPGFNFELALQELRGLSVRCRQQHKYRRDRKQPRQMRAVSREVHNFGRNCNGIVNASMAPCESPPKILALAGLWAVFVYSGYLQAPLLKDCNSAHRPHIFPCDVSATVTHLRHHRRTQRPTGRLPDGLLCHVLPRIPAVPAGDDSAGLLPPESAGGCGPDSPLLFLRSCCLRHERLFADIDFYHRSKGGITIEKTSSCCCAPLLALGEQCPRRWKYPRPRLC